MKRIDSRYLSENNTKKLEKQLESLSDEDIRRIVVNINRANLQGGEYRIINMGLSTVSKSINLELQDSVTGECKGINIVL